MSPRARSITRNVSLSIVLLVVLLLAGVKLAYGGGEPYPDHGTAPALGSEHVEALATLDYPPGNVAVSADGRVFFNTHPFVRSERFADAFLFELVDGEPRPYPSAALQPELESVFGMTVDARGRLWVTSPATLDRERTRISAFDLASGERVVDHWLEPGVGRFAQDLRVSRDGRTLYLADTGAFHFLDGALLVVDLETWSVREVLHGHASTRPQDWTIATEHGPHRIGYGLLTFAVGVDGLALSPDDEWLYYATMTHDTLYRVRTRDLRDASLGEAELGGRVERVGDKPLSDGIAVDAEGRVLLTDIEHGGIDEVAPDGTLRTLVRIDGVVWSDGIALAPDGAILLTDSAIPSYLDPLLRPPAEENLRAARPYHLYRIRR